MCVKVDESRQQGGIRVVEGLSGRTGHIRTGSDDSAILDGNATGAVDAGVSAEDVSGSDHEVGSCFTHLASSEVCWR